MPSPIQDRTRTASSLGRVLATSLFLVLLPLLVLLAGPSAFAGATVQGSAEGTARGTAQGRVPGAAVPDAAGDWRWPVDGVRQVTEPFRAPAHDYGAGHRGMDIAAASGATVRAPADGVVAFRGVVVDRPLLTIDHGDGVVSTFEPMESDLAAGAIVHAGDPIGVVADGGHALAGSLHVGVRLNGVYINPMLMFGDVPRAVLLPCCDVVTREGGRVGRWR